MIRLRQEFQTTPAERAHASISSTTELWRSIFLRSMPERSRAIDFANTFLEHFIEDAAKIAITESIIEQNDIGLIYRPFARTSNDDRASLKALTVMRKGSPETHIVINTDYDKDFDDPQLMHAGLSAHELAHLFFRDKNPPYRTYGAGISDIGWMPSDSKRQEVRDAERFCDDFAVTLTGFDSELEFKPLQPK